MDKSSIVLPMPSRTTRPWLTIVTALVIRDFGLRFRKHRPIVALVVFLEPIVLVVMISMVRVYLYGGHPPFGSSVLLFMGAGIFPFYAFKNSSNGVRSQKSRASEYYIIRPFDYLIAHFIIQQLQILALTFLFFTGLWLSGIPEAAPYAPHRCALGILALATFALGIGLINGMMRSYFEAWNNVYSILSRPMMMFSGVFKTVDTVPEPARTVFTWNPISHAIELIRSGIYPNYPIASFDGVYLTKCCVGFLFVGIVLYNNKSKD